MIFKSRTTKQLSNVIEQNAFRRSPGSSMSLMRTSVISTSFSLRSLARPIGNCAWRKQAPVAVCEEYWLNAVRALHGDKRQNKRNRCR